jgi:hypothetical protein
MVQTLSLESRFQVEMALFLEIPKIQDRFFVVINLQFFIHFPAPMAFVSFSTMQKNFGVHEHANCNRITSLQMPRPRTPKASLPNNIALLQNPRYHVARNQFARLVKVVVRDGAHVAHAVVDRQLVPQCGMVSISARRTALTDPAVEKTAATSGSSTTARLPWLAWDANRFAFAFL